MKDKRRGVCSLRTMGVACETRAELQSRLDAIAAITGRHLNRETWLVFGKDECGDVDTLARGTPARSVKAALKRWLPAKGGKEGK